MPTAVLGLKNDFASSAITDGQANAWSDDLEAVTAGYVEIDVSGAADKTLSAAQYACPRIKLSGVLTGSINVKFPLDPRSWQVWNATTGAFSVTCKTVSGTGSIVTQGKTLGLFGDGTNLVVENTDTTDEGSAASGANADITSMAGLTGAIGHPTQINDSSGNEVLKFASTASAVNEVTATNAATGNAPQLGATGGDTDIDLKLVGKGAGTPVQVGGEKVGTGGTLVKQMKSGTVTLDPASLAAATTRDDSVTITGVAVGDYVQFDIPSALEAGLICGGCYVSGADTVKIRLANVTALAIDGASLSWRYMWWKLV